MPLEQLAAQQLGLFRAPQQLPPWPAHLSDRHRPKTPKTTMKIVEKTMKNDEN